MATAEVLSPTPTSALVKIESMTPEMLFAPGAIDPLIDQIKAEVRAQKPDLTTDKGRKAVASLAYKVSRTKTFIDEGRQKLVADEKKRLAAIDAEGRRIREELDALRDEVRQPLTEWEKAEEARVAEHDAQLTEIGNAGTYTLQNWQTLPLDAMRERLEEIKGEAREWEEFADRAAYAKEQAIQSIESAIARRVSHDEQQAELEQLRREKADREERDRQEREAREAAERAEKEAREAHEREERERQQREEAILRATEEAEERARKAEEAAKAAAEQAERDRVTRHRLEIERIRAFGNSAAFENASAAALEQRIATLESEQREWEEFGCEAQTVLSQTVAVLESALSVQRERERIAAEKAAEDQRQRIAEQERERLEEQQRAEDAAAAKREANKRHRAKVHGEAKDALVLLAGLTADQATAAIRQIADGQIPNVSITY